MNKTETTLANRAIHLAGRGTVSQLTAFEDTHGPLSSVIDDLIEVAMDAGAHAMVRRLEGAYNRLTA